MSYLNDIYLVICHIYLGSWFSWFERAVQKTLKKEENRQKNYIEKLRERKTKNTGKIK